VLGLGFGWFAVGLTNLSVRVETSLAASKCVRLLACVIFLCVVVMKVFESYTSIRVYFWLYQFAIFLMMIPYVSIRHLKMLAPFSMLANVLTIIGLVVTVYYCVIDLPDVSDRPAVASASTLPLYFGIAIFTFEVNVFIVCITIDVDINLSHEKYSMLW